MRTNGNDQPINFLFRPPPSTQGLNAELLQRLGERLSADDDMSLAELQEVRRRQEKYGEEYLAGRERWREIVERYIRALYRLEYPQSAYRDAITKSFIEEMVEKYDRGEDLDEVEAILRRQLAEAKVNRRGRE